MVPPLMHQLSRGWLSPLRPPDASTGQMFYASFEVQSNVWMAERREPTAR